MKFTLGWLKQHLETDAALTPITEALTDLGHEVEGIEDPSAQLGAFRIARVIEAVQHPNADRLRVCRVETRPDGPDGRSEEVQVVCGAPNARTGLVGVFAPPGTHVPGTGVDLKPGVIRGVESNGMLCSERELMLSEDHDGIIELPDDAPLGARYIDWRGLADPVVEIKVTPNRPDALGIAGIARDLAARGLGRLVTPPVAPVAGSSPCPIRVEIDPTLRDRGCPVFAARLIRGVRNGASPPWLQDRLKAIGLRPISALVDITNFLTYDRNRPLHVFDADLIAGDVLRVHPAQGGESIVALDGKTYTLDPGMMAISDANGPESIAGIMGGMATGCTEATVNVLVESAYWDPITIAATGRRLKITSDARYRFERGVDPAFTPEGLDLATAMILDLCGGEASQPVIAGAVPDTARSYRLDTARVQSLVGMDIAPAEQRRILTALGFAVAGDAAVTDVAVPSWRPDVRGEADLVEEVARVASLTLLQGKPMPRPAGVARPVLTEGQRREQAARCAMAALGYNECVTYSFIDQKLAALFGGGTDATALANPIAADLGHLRPDLLPGLLSAAARNQARGFPDLALFEIGPVFSGGEPGDESVQVTGLRTGASAARDPHGSRRPIDIFDARADAEAALAAAGAPARLMLQRTAPAWFHPGRSGSFMLGPKAQLASFGEVHPRVLRALDLRGPVVAFTLSLAAIPPARRRSIARPALVASDYQAVERDFAFVVGARVEGETLLKAAFGADKALIEAVTLFDEFAGPRAEAQMGPGLKSLALTVRMQPRDRTLADAEIEAVSERIVAAVIRATGGTLRS
jgi:phenylalanyl-tRNA synthetase beta chain